MKTTLKPVSKEAFYSALMKTTINVISTIVSAWDNQRGYEIDFTQNRQIWGKSFSGDGCGNNQQYWISEVQP